MASELTGRHDPTVFEAPERALGVRLVARDGGAWEVVLAQDLARRAALYAAARHIYLDEPHGKDGFWPRLATLQADALLVWGRRDELVPIGFARHVADAVPHATQLGLDCGHVPQIERQHYRTTQSPHSSPKNFALPRGKQLD